MSNQKFSKIFSLPIGEIYTNEELFQGRDKKFSQETYDKILREGFDTTQDPIVVWKDENLERYFVVSGHSRFAAAQKLYNNGDENLNVLPVKEFLGDVESAVSYAILESNRSGTAEGLLSDIKAYKKALKNGCNAECLKGYFKTQPYINTLQRLSFLDEEGKFIEYLADATLGKQFAKLQQIAEWIGEIRKEFDKLSDKHEKEIFDFVYDGKSRINENKEEFLKPIKKAVASFIFDPNKPLNLKNFVHKSVYQIQAETQVQILEKEIADIEEMNDVLERKITKFGKEGKDTTEFETNLISNVKLIGKKKLQIIELPEYAKKATNATLDLFASAETVEPKKEVVDTRKQEFENLLELLESSDDDNVGLGLTMAVNYKQEFFAHFGIPIPTIKQLQKVKKELYTNPTKSVSIADMDGVYIWKKEHLELTSFLPFFPNLYRITINFETHQIPDGILHCKKVQELTIAEYKSKFLPKEIWNMVSLDMLHISGENISDIPKEIANLSNLTSLNLKNTKISKIPKEIGNLKNLCSLLINRAPIDKLPSEISNLKKLRFLNLKDCLMLKTVSSEINGFKNLVSLDLEGTPAGYSPQERAKISEMYPDAEVYPERYLKSVAPKNSKTSQKQPIAEKPAKEDDLKEIREIRSKVRDAISYLSINSKKGGVNYSTGNARMMFEKLLIKAETNEVLKNHFVDWLQKPKEQARKAFYEILEYFPEGLSKYEYAPSGEISQTMQIIMEVVKKLDKQKKKEQTIAKETQTARETPKDLEQSLPDRIKSLEITLKYTQAPDKKKELEQRIKALKVTLKYSKK